MMFPHHRPNLESMIARAMQDRAPKMFHSLQVSGELSKVIAERADQAEETYEEMYDQAKDKVLTSKMDYLESVQALTMAHREAEEIALAQATEFESEEPENDLDAMA